MQVPLVPFPEYPVSQVQLKLPTVLSHMALISQLCPSVSHSSTSEGIYITEFNKDDISTYIKAEITDCMLLTGGSTPN